MLITRTRNRLIPRHAVIQAAASTMPGLAERALDLAGRGAPIDYAPRPGDLAEIIGVVVYAMAPI